MIYITGDCHCDFQRFTKKRLSWLPYAITEKDYVIVCGDFGLLWAKDAELEYNCKFLTSRPFTILWVSGNHENYDMIKEYPIEMWNGGKVRHIVKDKIILLERGQVFNIEGKTFFTMGGASSHDVQGGILDKDSPTYDEDRRKAIKSELPYRVKHYSWWEEELPTEEELEEGRKNLQSVDYKVDYVIAHCMASRMQDALEEYYKFPFKHFTADILTDFFDELEDKLEFKKFYCGHYHEELMLDEKHEILYKAIKPLD